MIRYALRCDRDHEFEMWFRSGGDYDRAAKAKRIECPDCGSTSVAKALMAPSVAGTRSEEMLPVAAPDPRKVALRQAMLELRKQVTEGADYVGPRFAEEARKIHYNEVEARGIYGEASNDEAKGLAEEGIGFMPLPPAPEDLN
jgi:hypothetical protein